MKVLTNGPIDFAPSWSPDGAKIALVRDLGRKNVDIYMMNRDGTGVERLTDDPAVDVGPQWSPDGTKIAFHSDRDGDFDLYVMNTDGTSVAQVTDDPAGDSLPSWSPDDAALAFGSDRDGNLEIYVIVRTAPERDGSLTIQPRTATQFGHPQAERASGCLRGWPPSSRNPSFGWWFRLVAPWD